MNDKQLVKNISVSAVVKPLTMLLSMIYVPILLSYIGEERYGVWVTISSFVQWITLCDIGIGNGMRNKLAESYTRGDVEKSKIIVSTTYTIMTIIFSFIFIIFFMSSFVFDYAKFLGIQLVNERMDKVLMITVFFVCVNFVFGLANTIQFSLQHASVPSIFGFISQFVIILVVLITKQFLHPNLVIIALLFGVSQFIVNVAFNIFTFVKNPEIFPSLIFFRRDVLASVVTLGSAFLIGQVCSMVMNATDNILISKFFTPNDVTPYSIEYKLFMVFIQIQGVLIMPMWSAFTSAAAEKNYSWIKSKIKIMNYIAAILSFGVIGISFLMRFICHLWLRTDLNFDTYTTIIMTLYFCIYLFSSNYASLLCGLGEVKVYSGLALFSGILNIPLSLLLAVKLRFGLVGIILGTFIPMLVTLIVYIIKIKRLYKAWRV